ncbi:MAG: polyprenyl synthetase family protein, partial [Litoricolaceae bacterium]|nr:polyprenyl synthetase family protein [Litorivicinaceae bacterium]
MDQDWLDHIRIRIDAALDHALGAHLGDSKLLEAARYSVLRGGKRLRPALVYAAAEAVDASQDAADAAAISVELLHAYSLIHDDLPAMDDDALRRGQPTTHIAFDEATAILAGDALQALAFSILGQDDSRTNAVRVKQLRLLGDAVGFQGMALGQAVDLESEGKAVSLDALKAMHAKKTGALITASLLMGAACGEPSDSDWDALTQAGEAIGLA